MTVNDCAERGGVLTISIHGHPRFTYPYFSGFHGESGQGTGQGCNVNYPLPEQISGQQYLKTLQKALNKTVRFDPA
jgi:acetoin utilization deacetylase AcuC-like enzyme